MYLSFLVSGIEIALMTIEASNVISMRLQMVMRGGPDARDESFLMISEKISAFAQAGADMATGVSNASIRANFRAAIQANAMRLESLRPSAQ